MGAPSGSEQTSEVRVVDGLVVLSFQVPDGELQLSMTPEQVARLIYCLDQASQLARGTIQ